MKNNLGAEDATIVDKTFKDRIEVWAPEGPLETSPCKPTTSLEPVDNQLQSDAPNTQPTVADAALPIIEPAQGNNHEGRGNSLEQPLRLGLVKPRRSRDKDHLRFIAIQPCTICGRQPCEAHHIRYAQPRALGCRVSDEFTVPLCRVHHRELHAQGDEHAWWGKFKMDPMPIALRYWQHTRGIPPSARSNMKAQDRETGAAQTNALESGSSEPSTAVNANTAGAVDQ
jgi:hypothetical protein